MHRSLVSCPGLFLTFNDVTWLKVILGKEGNSPYMGASLPKPNSGHMVCRISFVPFLGERGSLGDSVWTPRSGIPELFHEEHRTEFLKKLELYKKFWNLWGHQACRLASLFSPYVLYISVVSYSDKLSSLGESFCKNARHLENARHLSEMKKWKKILKTFLKNQPYLGLCTHTWS